MEENINEEIERMLYLSGHKRGVVISEQGPIRDWLRKMKAKRKAKKLQNKFGKSKFNKGKNKREYAQGKIPDWSKLKPEERKVSFVNAASGQYGNTIVAKNIKGQYYNDHFKEEDTYMYDLAVAAAVSVNVEEIINPVKKGRRKPEAYFGEGNFPYPDNFITPFFEIQMPRYIEAKKVMDKFIEDLVYNIDTWGVDSLIDITVQGSADSAHPTNQIPSEVRALGINSLDHNYGGLGNNQLIARNQFLADNRGITMGNYIIDQIKNKTTDKVDISNKVKVLKGINYLNDSNMNSSTRQGVKAIEISYNGQTEQWFKDKEKEKEKLLPKPQKFVDLTPFGLSLTKVNVVTIPDSKNNVQVCISDEDYNKIKDKVYVYQNGKLGDKDEYPASINDNDELIINDINFGKFDRTTPYDETDKPVNQLCVRRTNPGALVTTSIITTAEGKTYHAIKALQFCQAKRA